MEAVVGSAPEGCPVAIEANGVRHGSEFWAFRGTEGVRVASSPPSAWPVLVSLLVAGIAGFRAAVAATIEGNSWAGGAVVAVGFLGVAFVAMRRRSTHRVILRAQGADVIVWATASKEDAESLSRAIQARL